MPLYEYVCEANGRKVEVRHGMKESIETWGQLCEAAGLEPGKTPKTAKVERAISGGMILTKPSGDSGPAPSGGGCPGGRCSCH